MLNAQNQHKWLLKGEFYECCRANGHCPLWFGRDLTGGTCVNLDTRRITEGQIQGVDMKGAVFAFHCDGIGPKYSDIGPGKQGTRELAIYIADNATDEQKNILSSFLTTHMEGPCARNILGVKIVKIDIEAENGVYHVKSPYFEQHMALTAGRDKSPIRMENPDNPALNNVKFCNTLLWKYNDYGKTLEYHQTSGAIANFEVSGND